MNKRKFKITCNLDNSPCWGNKTNLIVELEDSSTIDREAATALCLKLKEHFQENHPEHNLYHYRKGCVVKQGNDWAVLQADGTIKNCKLNAGDGGYSSKHCTKCGRELREFIDNTF